MRTLISIAVLAVGLLCAAAQDAKKVEINIGDKAPAFGCLQNERIEKPCHRRIGVWQG